MHIDWNTKPYLYPNLLEQLYNIEPVVFVFGGAAYLILAAYLLSKYVLFVGQFFEKILDPARGQANATGPRNQFFVGLSLLAIALTLYVLPIIG